MVVEGGEDGCGSVGRVVVEGCMWEVGRMVVGVWGGWLCEGVGGWLWECGEGGCVRLHVGVWWGVWLWEAAYERLERVYVGGWGG